MTRQQPKRKRGELPFQLRARIIGGVDWICPYCGYLHKSKIVPGQWRVQCKHRYCKRHFGIGVLFYDLSPLIAAGQKVPVPPDCIFPNAAKFTPIPDDRHVHQHSPRAASRQR